MTDGYEYGVGRVDAPLTDEEVNPHREGMTKEQAEQWVAEWDEMWPGATRKFMAVIRRPVGEWQYVD